MAPYISGTQVNYIPETSPRMLYDFTHEKWMSFICSAQEMWKLMMVREEDRCSDVKYFKGKIFVAKINFMNCK